MSTPKPKYVICWWCNRQLWSKRFHITMRATNTNESPVLVHRACSESMEREGDWEVVPKLDVA